MRVAVLPSALSLLHMLPATPPFWATWWAAIVQLLPTREDTSQSSHERILQAFASWVIEFTGEEEVIYEFSICDSSEVAASNIKIGTVQATAQDAPRNSACLAADLRFPQLCNIVTTETGNGDTDFGLVIDFGDTKPVVSERLRSKPFVACFTPCYIEVIFSSTLLPQALATSVGAALADRLAGAAGCQSVGLRPEPSVLNYPPQMDPPAWEHGPGIVSAASPQELLHSAFLRRANEHPDHIAVEYLSDMSSPSSTYSYGELEKLSSALAREILCVLGSVDSKNQRVVPVFLSTSPELYIAWLAVLKAGCIFCPLPVEAPPDFLSGILEETSAGLILGHGRPAGAVKACLLPRALRWIDVHGFIVEGPTFAAPTFDPSVMEIFVSLSTGMTLCGCKRQLALTDPEAAIGKLRASIMMATPSMAALLRPDRVPTLKYLWTMGETLGRTVIESFAFDSRGRENKPGTALVNAYGPTEGSINCTLHNSVSSQQRGSVIGHALPTCSMFVLDVSSSSQSPVPVPLGFPGELAIGGPQVSAGYLNRPEHTAAAFVESKEFGRLYRTGDKARIVQERDGCLVVDFLGRITTDQVKLSGRRVDLGDIEAAIASHLVHDAAAIVQSDSAVPGESSGSEQVVIFLVPHQPYDAGSVLDLCAQNAERLLQPYMRPSRYYVLDTLPRSTSGKLNRKALKALLASDDLKPLLPSLSVDQTKATSAGDERTDAIRQVLADVTRISPAKISPSAVLLSIGFDSLRAVQFLQRCRELGFGEISITDALNSRTLQDLVACIYQQHGETTEVVDEGDFSTLANRFASQHLATCSEALEVSPSDIESVLPTTATQAGMLASFLRSLDADEGSSQSAKSYINHSVYTIAAGHHPDDVCRAWTSVIRRHPMSRTVFVQVDDALTPFAQCLISAATPLAEVTCNVYTCLSDAEFDAAVYKATEKASSQIRLEHPPVRLSVIHSSSRSTIVLSMFHGVFDGGSLQLLLEDVGREYQGLLPLSRPGIDVAVARHFTSDRVAATQYWLSSLEGNTSTPFPNLRTSVPELSHRVCRTSSVQSDLTLDAIRSSAAALQCSPLAMLHTAWSLILFSYTGCPADVTFGSVISDRFSAELAGCSGPTFTTVPIRVNLGTGEQQSSVDVARSLTTLQSAALGYLHTPLSSVLGEDGRLPYDTLFAFQEFPQGSGGGQEMYSMVKFPAMINDFAVMVEIWPTQSGNLELKATYDYSLLDETAALTMLEQLNKSLSNIINRPDLPFSDGQFAFPRHMLSEAGHPRAVLSSEPLLLHSPFEQYAARSPDKLALLFISDLHEDAEASQMTFGELNQRADQVAVYLRALLNASPDAEDRVIPICMVKCPDLYVAILGILKAGAAWCPIDPAFPPARQNHLIERTGSKIVLVSSSTSFPSAEAIPAGVDIVDFITQPWAQGAGNHVVQTDPCQPREEDLAYLIFTSGTTGPPKGVPVSHRAASSAMRALEESIPGTSTCEPVRCMQFSQYTFDVFVQDLFYTWRVGGTVVSASHDIVVGAFAELANRTKATHAHLTPAFGASIRRSDLHTLQVITMIGEKLPQRVADDWGAEMRAFNTYGPAEAAVVSTVQQFGSVQESVRSSNIGRPLRSVQAYVMRSGKPVLKNGVGELVLAGIQLARGYWGDPAITSKKFVWNDFAQAVVYHTGDIVRQLADGSFDFVGRDDDLVKINGMRVELSEIAATCCDCSEFVDQAEVMYTPLSGSTENSVVCFFGAAKLGSDAHEAGSVLVGEDVQEITHHARLWAQARLPKHMLPDLFIFLNTIPRTPSAKVDRKALLALLKFIDTSKIRQDEIKQQVVDAGWIAEHSSLLAILRSVAKFPGNQIGPATALSDLGVDSIGAITLSSKLKKESHTVSVLDVLRCKYVGEIVALLSRSRQNGHVEEVWKHQLSLFDASWRPSVCAALKTSDFTLAPSTIMQEGVLTETLREPLSYWGNYFFTLSNSVDLKRLQGAWRKVITNTEALRASFLPIASLHNGSLDGQRTKPTFLQIIRPEFELPWLEETSDSEDRVALAWHVFEKTAREHHAQGLSAPPWKVTLLNTPSKTTMLVTMHHSIYDADSVEYLLHDVATAYEERTPIGPRCQLSEAIARANLIDVEDGSREFWKTALQPFVEDEENKAGFMTRAGSAHRTEELQLSLSLSRLRLAAKEMGVSSINSLFRVVWGSMLAELAETSQFLFAEIRSDRVVDARLAGAIAPLVSTLPVPFVSEGTPREQITRQDKLLRDSLQHRQIRPGTVRGLIRKPPSEPLYPAVLVFHPEQSSKGDESHALWEAGKEAFDIAVEHPLALNVFEKAHDSILLRLSVDAKMMTAMSQQCFLHELDALLTSMLQQPGAPSLLHLTEVFPSQLRSISSPNPKTNCPAEWQPTHWVERWAKEHPDWIAAEIAQEVGLDDIETTSWTYGQLNAEANRISSWIHSQQVRSSAIGLCLERDLLSLAIILGIMKSGNTYIPIEEGLPLERKAFLLEDSGAALMFTSPGLFEYDTDRTKARVIDVTDSCFIASVRNMDSSDPEDQGDLSDDVYLLYTSGSTGKPKGVRVNRRNLSSFLEAQTGLICREAAATRELGGRGKYLCLASRAFDVHIGEMFLAWRYGLAAVTGPRLLLLDNLPLCLRALRITHASFVPSLLDQTGLTPADTPDLVYLGVGGEKMTPRTQDIWSSSTRVNLVNAYGPTEVTVGCCSGRVYPNSDPRNIGKPLGDSVAHVYIPGTEIHVKRGMPGELAFTGSLVATGYHNRPDAQGFVVDHAGERMYRTGDIVCMAPDGSIIFMGRKDDQVKVRGQRLELSEISEAVRGASPDPIDVATLLLQHPHISRPQLISFVAYAGQKKQTDLFFLPEEFERLGSRLQKVCQKVLPAYMVPDLLIPVSHIPLTQTSAKADNKLLKSLFQSIPSNQLFREEPAEAEEVVRALSAAEKQVVEIIQGETSNVDPLAIKPTTSIFNLGIDSLRAINVSVKLKNAGFECSVASVLQNPTIERLAAFRRGSPRAQEVSKELNAVRCDLESLNSRVRNELSQRGTIPDANIVAVRPCLPLQEALVAHSIANRSDGESNYINHIVFRVAPDIEPAALLRAWDVVIRTHDILRTTFCCLKRDIVQVVLRAEAYAQPYTRLETAHSLLDGAVKALRPILANDILKSLEVVPPLRLTAATSESDSWLLMLSIHHSLYDMETLGMLVKDVQVVYLLETIPSRPSTQPLFEHLALSKKHSGKANEHWTSVFHDWTQTPLPILQPGALTKEATRVFSGTLTNLEALCSSSGFTLAALMQGIYGYALAQARLTDDVVFGTVLSGRSTEVIGVESMMVPCITTIPHRVNLSSSGESLSELVCDSQKQYFSSLEHQYTPLRDIQAWVGASGPLFDTIFSFVRTSSSSTDIQSQELMALVEDDMSLEYSLAVECEANSATDEVVLRGRAISTCDSLAEMETVLEQVEMLVSAVLRGDSTKVASFGTPAAPVQGDTRKQEYDESTWTGLESQVREAIMAFSDVSLAGVSKNTSFIRLGIDSISSIQFAKELWKTGLAVSSADIMRNPSVGALAQHIQTRLDTHRHARAENASALKIPSDAKAWSPEDRIVSIYPLTPLQTGMITSTLSLDPQLYSHHHAFDLAKGIDLGRLEESWKKLLLTHEILRTSFHPSKESSSHWLGAVHSEPMLKWETFEAANVQVGLRQLAQSIRYVDHASFETPPVKATVIKDALRTVLVVSMHHVTYDGVSVSFLFDDLLSLYIRETAPERPPFSKAAAAIWSSAQASTSFWSRQLQGYKSFDLAADLELSTPPAIAAHTLDITNDVSAMINRCLDLDTTLQTSALVAFGKALCTTRGARDVVFGQVVAGRNLEVDGADLISGPMFNTVPLRLRLPSLSESNGELLRRMQDGTNKALSYEHVSLAEVQKRWRGQSNSVIPLFDSIFVFQRNLGTQRVGDTCQPPWSPFSVSDEGAALAPSEYNMNFELHQQDDGRLVVQAYSILPVDKLETFARLFKDTLEDMLQRPDNSAVSFPEQLSRLPAEPVAAQATAVETEKKGSDNEAIAKFFTSIQRILAEVAGVPHSRIKPSTSVFSIGLDSILAIRVSSECRKAGLSLGAVDVMKAVTVEKICNVALNHSRKEQLKTSGSHDTHPMVTPIVKDAAISLLRIPSNDLEDVLPLLAGQEYHLAAWLHSGRTLYEPSWTFRSREPLDSRRLQRAWAELRRRHPILRSCFVSIGKTEAVQVVLRPESVPSPDPSAQVHSTQGGESLETRARQIVKDIASAPSTLLTPPVRLTHIQGGGDGDAVLVTVHHVAYDAWTMVRLLPELSSLYAGGTLPPPAPSFAKLIGSVMRDARGREAEVFWKKALTGSQNTTIRPRATPAMANTPSSRKQTFVLVSGSQTDLAALERACQAVGTNPQSILLLAFSILLFTETGSSRPVFGYFQTGRSASFDNIESVSGPCLNMLPFTPQGDISTIYESTEAMTSLLSSIQRTMAERMAYEQSFLRDVLRWMEREDGDVPFNTHLNILWNEELFIPPAGDQQEPLLQPLGLGVPTDFSSQEAIPGTTAVDSLDMTIIPTNNVFVDVGPNRKTGKLEFGSRCDATLMEKQGLEEFVQRYDQEIWRIVEKVSFF
ncbi:acetyl-CoA synthetase-like protein [Thozetella sp. PMI_491]|nr:acetyl-CoA synthetase-like protein [Thozetella sp. PMI_491]